VHRLGRNSRGKEQASQEECDSWSRVRHFALGEPPRSFLCMGRRAGLWAWAQQPV